MALLLSWDARLQNLVLRKEHFFGSWWLDDALRAGAPNVLSRSSGTLQSILGLVFDNTRIWRFGGAVASLDLRGFSALKRLSLASNHQMQLWLPPTMQHLEINIYGGSQVGSLRYVNHWSIGLGWDGYAEEVVRGYADYALAVRRKEPMVWGEALEVTSVDDENAPLPRYGRPTWAQMLKGLTQLGTLQVHGSNVTTWEMSWDSAGWSKPDEKGAYPRHFMGLTDFEREWPMGFALQNLHVRCSFVPFDLAVRDVELLQFSESVVFMTRASRASQILDLLLCGRARLVRFRARCRKGLRTRFTWVGPGLGRGVGVNPSDLVQAARSSRFAFCISVNEFKAEAPNDGWCLDLTVVARLTDCDEEPGL